MFVFVRRTISKSHVTAMLAFVAVFFQQMAATHRNSGPHGVAETKDRLVASHSILSNWKNEYLAFGK